MPVNRRTKLSVAGILGIVVLGAAAGLGLRENRAGLLPYEDADAIASGVEIYRAYCADCHGADLEGEPNWRDRDSEGYLPAPPHDETGHTWHHPDAQLIAITTLGTEAIVGGTYRSRMIGFGDTLTATEIRNVLAYVKSTWPPEIIERHNQINADAERE